MRVKVISSIFVVFFLIFTFSPIKSSLAATTTFSVSPSITPEGNDYATEVLGNAWDMNSLSEISKYFESSGVLVDLTNVQFQNGIFSARSTDGQAYFYPLFPGYGDSDINTGNYGINYPINSAKYHCLSTRMKIDSGQTPMKIFWFQDGNASNANQFGFTQNIWSVQTSPWHIYNVDLNRIWDSQNSPLSWSAHPSWQGMRIDPTSSSNVNFSFDWVRLTDCQARNVTLTWTPTSSQVEIWMGRSANTSDTLLAGAMSGNSGSYIVDTQGWETGDYFLGLKNKSTGQIQWTTLHVEPKPKINILKPSFTSGAGILWNMDSPSDILTGPNQTRCLNYSFSNSLMDIFTLPPGSIGSGCTAGGYSDPAILFRLPLQTIDSTQYRYLSMRVYNFGAYQDINRGWIYRWLWQYYVNNNPDRWCIGVTWDIPIDVGWGTYVIDFQKNAGNPEYMVGANQNDCPIAPWSANPINMLRFDPNENGMPGSFHQQIDWVSLNKMDQVRRGTLFSINIDPSKPLDSLSLSFYYTLNLANPTEYPVTIAKPQPRQPPNWGNHPIFLATIINQSNMTTNGISYLWDTSNVPTGIYYICVKSNDTYGNTATNCSEAPVKVY